jgi:hypothetical protein
VSSSKWTEFDIDPWRERAPDKTKSHLDTVKKIYLFDTPKNLVKNVII